MRSARSLVPRSHPTHLDRADPGLNEALRPQPVSHDAVTPIRQLLALHRSQERLGFRLDSLGQQPAGAAPQNGGQRIIDRVGLTEWDNSAIALHGVSLLREVRAGWLPASIRRLSQTAITQFRP
jgi:hypothetical protein